MSVVEMPERARAIQPRHAGGPPGARIPAAARRRLALDGRHGVALVVLAAVHIVAQHFVVDDIGGLRTLPAGPRLLSHPVIFALECGFLFAVTIHAMLGMRSVLLDFDLRPRARRRLDPGLWLARHAHRRLRARPADHARLESLTPCPKHPTLEQRPRAPMRCASSCCDAAGRGPARDPREARPLARSRAGRTTGEAGAKRPPSRRLRTRYFSAPPSVQRADAAAARRAKLVANANPRVEDDHEDAALPRQLSDTESRQGHRGRRDADRGDELRVRPSGQHRSAHDGHAPHPCRRRGGR